MTEKYIVLGSYNLKKTNYKIEKSGYHQPDKIRVSSHNCGCKLETEKGAYRDHLVTRKEFQNKLSDVLIFYHQSCIIKKAVDPETEQTTKIYVNTHGYENYPTTRKRINRHLPADMNIVQRDFQAYLKLGDQYFDCPRHFEIDMEQKDVIDVNTEKGEEIAIYRDGNRWKTAEYAENKDKFQEVEL